MNGLRISTIATRSLVTGVVAVAALLAHAADAKADVFNDSFNGQGSPATAWSFWASSPSHSVAQIVNNSTYAHSGPNFLAINLDSTTTGSDFNMAYRTFNAPHPGPVLSCSVFAEIRAFYTETVSLQMVNPNNWTYIAIDNAAFTNPVCSNPDPSTCYGHGYIANTYPCSNAIQVRLVVTGGSGARLAYLDDIAVTFNQ
jgi:hypothetical protein